ncbi:hypothetical protein [Actinoplanes regularis]|uniref:hypothetical protein n=1 Tax=Actinoplanes regularis TaxID=52697 RepID=UPI002552AC3C|nr:hypothetical protein [Actinoplanes regularis]GLW27972.1 hypothetical protein Areg01_09120 [Actinoplanes regularis]
MPPDASPVAAPVRPRRRAVLPAVSLALICAVTTTLFLLTREKTGADAIGAAADRLYDQSATAVEVTYADPDGESISGKFTLDDELNATGTITDPVAGAADLVEYTAYSAVRGDADWWSRRNPDQAGALRKKWATPSADPFPVELTGNFDPGSLAHLLTQVRDHGTVIPVEDPFRGRRVAGMTWNGWSVLVTTESPQTLVWLGGPITRSGPIKPVSWARPQAGPRSATPTAFHPTSAYAGGPHPARYALAPVAVPQPPYVSVTVNDAPDGAAQSVQRAVAKVLPEAARSGGLPAPEEPPVEGSVLPKLPHFESTVNATNCTTPTCRWTVTVTNTGTAAGRASVVATVSPGMPTRTISIGTLQPGESRTTAPMTFANPAPRVAGRTTQVPVDYTADIFSPDLAGASAAVINRLRSRGIEIPNASILNNGDEVQKAIAYRALDVMSGRAGFRPGKVLAAVENAFRQNAVPELQTLTQSGRLENPQDLAEKLSQLDFEIDPDPTAPQPDKGRIGFRREVQVAVTTLRADPRARVLLDGVKAVGGRRYRVDLLVERAVSGRTETEAFQIKTVSSDKLNANLRTALRQLNGRNPAASSTGVAEHAPPGSRRIALIYLEPAAGWIQAADRAGLERKLTGSGRSSLLADWCVDGTAQADEVLIVNQLGTHRWSKEQMNALLDVSGQCV